LQVLPEYVPPAAVHSELELFLMVPEHAASGSASRATMAVVINIFLEPIVCCLLLQEDHRSRGHERIPQTLMTNSY
jgi:hypothetical protein